MRGLVRAGTAACPTCGSSFEFNMLSQLPERRMTDPRNIAHDKKVRQEKKHRGEELAPGADHTPQLGKKTHKEHHASDITKVPDEAGPVPTQEKPLD